MVNVPSVPEIITVNSETLQTQIRDLLPSQNGFGSELQASNVITPIIDLTSAAEGSTLPFDLRTAIAFGSQTAFDISNTTTVIANSPGFYRIFAAISGRTPSSGVDNASFTMTDGATTKTIYSVEYFTNSSAQTDVVNVDFNVWLAAGESISGVTDTTQVSIIGSVRQIANSSGELVNPSGYPL